MADVTIGGTATRRVEIRTGAVTAGASPDRRSPLGADASAEAVAGAVAAAGAWPDAEADADAAAVDASSEPREVAVAGVAPDAAADEAAVGTSAEPRSEPVAEPAPDADAAASVAPDADAVAGVARDAVRRTRRPVRAVRPARTPVRKRMPQPEARGAADRLVDAPAAVEDSPAFAPSSSDSTTATEDHAAVAGTGEPAGGRTTRRTPSAAPRSRRPPRSTRGATARCAERRVRARGRARRDGCGRPRPAGR